MSMHKRLSNLAEWGSPFVSWYDDARDFILMECDKRGWDHDVFVKTMAVTSPRISVKRNWDVTVNLMNGADMHKEGLISATRVALAHYRETGEIRGRKTEAFARALQGDTSALVLDVWMARALELEPLKVTTRANMLASTKLVTQVAQDRGWCVRDTQAAIWAGVCKAHGVTPGTLETAVLRSSQMSMEF